MAAKIKYTTHTSSIADALSNAYSELQELRDEMSEWADSIEERFSGTQKYEEVTTARDTLDGFVDSEPDPGELELEVTYQIGQKRKTPRWLRRDNAVSMMEAAKSAIDEFLEAATGTEQQIDDAEEVGNQLDNDIGEAQGVEFPGMMG